MKPSEVLRRAKELFESGEVATVGLAIWKAGGEKKGPYWSATCYWNAAGFSKLKRLDRAITLAKEKEAR